MFKPISRKFGQQTIYSAILRAQLLEVTYINDHVTHQYFLIRTFTISSVSSPSPLFVIFRIDLSAMLYWLFLSTIYTPLLPQLFLFYCLTPARALK
jgi:hypothetical protein